MGASDDRKSKAEDKRIMKKKSTLARAVDISSKDDQERNEYLKALLNWHAEESSYLMVIYTPDCGCLIEQFVVLDRYPMSKKIICQCPECKRGCLMEISDPIQFHLPLTKQDVSLQELADGVVTESRQKPFIEAYQLLYRKTKKIDSK